MGKMTKKYHGDLKNSLDTLEEWFTKVFNESKNIETLQVQLAKCAAAVADETPKATYVTLDPLTRALDNVESAGKRMPGHIKRLRLALVRSRKVHDEVHAFIIKKEKKGALKRKELPKLSKMQGQLTDAIDKTSRFANDINTEYVSLEIIV